MKKFVVGSMLCLLIFGGCKADSIVSSADSGIEPGARLVAQESNDNLHVGQSYPEVRKTVVKNPRQRRYCRPSTQVNFLLLNIENADTHEQIRAVIDNNLWLKHAADLDIPTEFPDYAEVMVTRDQGVFVVPSKLFEKFKAGAFEEDVSLQKLSNEEILERYFNEIGRSFVAKDIDSRSNRALIGNLLERDFLVFIDCESGELTVKP
ncbi:MAG: hypothetical protein ACI38Q_09650 [Candidatus Bruticola sp.]